LLTAMTVPGTGTVTATSGLVSGIAIVTITVGEASLVLVTPDPVSVNIGDSVPFIAVAYDMFNNIIPGASFTWTTDMGTVSSAGLFTAGTVAGTGTVSATSGTATGSAVVTVLPDPLDHITVSPDPVTVLIAGTVQFTVSGYDMYGNEITGVAYFWSTDVGAIDGTGLFTAQLVPGIGSVWASNGPITGTATVTVVDVPIDHILIMPDSANIVVGTSLQFTATAYDQFNNPISGVDFIWTTDIGSVDSNGLLTAQLMPGSGTVTALYGILSAAASVNIVMNSFLINIHAGWNLLSTTLVPWDTYIPNLLASIDGQYDRVLWYDPQDANPWRSFRVGSPLNTLTDINNTMGFWLHATADTVLTIYGSLPGNTSIQLHAGWNLVGYPSMVPTPASDALAGTGADQIAVYNSVSPFLIDGITDLSSVTMVPGAGYWVHVNASGSWNVTNAGPGNDDEICSAPPTHGPITVAATAPQFKE